MTAKEYLNRGYKANEIINGLLAEKQHLRDIATNITSTLSADRTFCRNISDKTGDTAVKLADLEHEIDCEVDKYIDIKREIRIVINAVKNCDEQLVLRHRYLEFMKWDEIANKMNYSIENVFVLHRRALKKITVNYSMNL